MKKLFFVVICLFLAGGLVSAQSLGEIAKKEKERRKNTAKDKPVRVITDQDVRTASDEESDESTEEETSPTPVTSSSTESPALSSREEMAADPWNEVFSGFREAYFEAREALEFLRGFRNHCENGTEPPPLPPILGGYWMLNCEGIPDDIERVENEMKEIQEAAFDRARRMGVPPGRARLN